MKGHPPTWSERFSSKSRWILGFILLFIGFYMFQTQRATAPSDIAQQSDVKLLPENQKTATNTCNWRPEPLAGQCDVTKPTEESKVSLKRRFNQN
jgi:cell division protein FtsN